MKRPRDKGAILVISLWALTLLSILAVGLAYRMSLELRLADYALGRIHLLYLVQGGVREACAILREDKPETDSFKDAWAKPTDPDKPLSLGEGSFWLTVEDELSRVNLNVADAETLLRIPAVEESFVEKLRIWRGDPGLPPSLIEQEEAYYRSLPIPIVRERKPIESLEELLLLNGMTSSLYETLSASFTVYGPGKVNLNTVSLEALVLLGLKEPLAQELLRYRSGGDGQPGTEDDFLFNEVTDLNDETMLEALGLTTEERLEIVNFLTKYQEILTVQSDHFRIHCKGVSKNGMTQEVLAILQRMPEAPAMIKYWHED